MKRGNKRGHPDEKCETCQKPLFIISKTNRVCLDNEQANAILCADSYNKDETKYGNSEIPAELPNRCYAASDSRLRINFKKATDILSEWKTSGLPVRAQKYLFWNHRSISNYLETHHSLKVDDPRLMPSTAGFQPGSSAPNVDNAWVESDDDAHGSGNSATTATSSDEEKDTESNPCSPQPMNLEDWLRNPEKG